MVGSAQPIYENPDTYDFNGNIAAFKITQILKNGMSGK